MRKIIFLDRDGVINRDPAEKKYVTCWSDFEFLPCAIETLKKLNKHGYDIIVASNQAGISRGLFTLKDLELINDKMLETLAKEGAGIKATYYCHHHDEDNCSCRKPKTGLLTRAIDDSGIEKFRWQDTYFIGDGKVDVEAGKKLGMKTILVLSGKTAESDLKSWDIKPDFIAGDLKEAVENFVLSKTSKHEKPTSGSGNSAIEG